MGKFIKYAQELCAENYETLLRTIKEEIPGVH